MMTTKNPTHKKIMDAAQKAKPAQAKSTIPDYMRSLVNMPDSALATEMVLQQSALDFDTGQGKDLPRFERECEENDKAFADSQDQLDALEAERKSTKRLVKSPNQDDPTPFNKMKIRDQIMIALLSLCSALVLVIGGVNAYVNLMASGIIVFLEQPWLACCIAMLVPAASMFFKLFSWFFDYAASKKRYAIFVYIVTSITIIAWMILFAQNFNGVAGEIDFSALGSSEGGKGAALVFVQTACEILIAAALFLAIEDVSVKYNPDVLKDNPDFHEISSALKKHKSEHDALSQKRNKAHTELTLLKNQRQQHLNDQASKFAALILSRNL